jgi:hypothetical protein
VTEVTNFPDSLAPRANVLDADQTAKASASCNSETLDEKVCTAEIMVEAKASDKRYWDAKVRDEANNGAGPPF